MSATSHPSEPLSAMASGVWVRQMVEGATALGLVERLAGGPREVGELATACGAQTDSLLRLLRGLASLGLLEETAPRRFAPTPMAGLLRSNHPGARREFVRLLGEDHQQRWEMGLRCVRRGVNAFRDRHGCSVFEWCRR
ncbi:MAG: hypothetical protein VKJ05_08890 [Synechococcaceae cyanobacterium]|nr:hypothetical protein [Synechococcaceae cyanobacterium]